MEEYIKFQNTKLAKWGEGMTTIALAGNAITWLSTFPRIYMVANFVLFIFGIILIMIAAINTYTKNKNITIRNIDYK